MLIFSGPWGTVTSNPGVSGGTKMLANADLITVETYFVFAIWRALGAFSDQTEPILLSSYSLTHIYVHVK